VSEESCPVGTADQAFEAQQSLPPRYHPPQPENRRSLRWVAWELEKGLTAGLTEGLISPFRQAHHYQ
jgi:hypothetical protein